MKKIISLLTVAMLIVCALTGCGGNKEAVATDGSTSMNKVIGALGEAFEADTGITVTYNATGSGAGIQAVEEGRCDIGIAPEHQSRIFERFYRVDKSHSKETGGTVLGLSIVKHAAQYHGGKVMLDSEVGKGTTITIVF